MATITRSQLLEGIWTGEITGLDAMPDVQAFLYETQLDGVQLSAGEVGTWIVTVPVPIWALTDGVQNFVLQFSDGTQLGAFTIISGIAVADDLRAEVDLLRMELDMLKKAFRQHVLQTLG
ncbi:MAG: hypothetical protein ACPG5U_00625 [Planktomarina sp.]